MVIICECGKSVENIDFFLQHQIKMHGLNLHDYGMPRYHTKLTPTDIVNMRCEYQRAIQNSPPRSKSKICKRLAAEYHVTPATINYWVNSATRDMHRRASANYQLRKRCRISLKSLNTRKYL